MTKPRMSSVPAVWAAFASQGRWKNWVMALQLLVLGLLTQVCFALARTEPDIIVVDEKGDARYVERTATSTALLRFLDTERRRPTDLSIASFTERFVRLTSGVNSATIEESWGEALGMMALPLAQKVDAEAKSQRLVETYKLAQIRTVLRLDDIQLLERRGDKALVRVTLVRQRMKLFSAELVGTEERQEVSLILAEVPRSRRRPDGLEILDWSTASRTSETSQGEAGGSVTPSSGGSK